MRALRSILKNFLIFLLIFFLNGCCFFCLRNMNEWKDDNPELFALAVSSLLGVPGMEDDELTIRQTDEYGRVFFSYATDAMFGPYEKCFSLFVAQKSDEEKVYFYPVVYFVEAEDEEDISEARIQTLLDDNDWGKPLDENKMDWFSIVRIKPDGSLKKTDTIVSNAFWDQFEKSENDYDPDWFFQGSDRKGRELFLLQSVKKDPSTGDLVYGTLYFLVILPDGTYDASTCLMEIVDQWNFQTDLSNFLESNHWNDPL